MPTTTTVHEVAFSPVITTTDAVGRVLTVPIPATDAPDASTAPNGHESADAPQADAAAPGDDAEIRALIRAAVARKFAEFDAEVDHRLATGRDRSGKPLRGFWTPTGRRVKNAPSRDEVQYDAIEDFRQALFQIVREEIRLLLNAPLSGGA